MSESNAELCQQNRLVAEVCSLDFHKLVHEGHAICLFFLLGFLLWPAWVLSSRRFLTVQNSRKEYNGDSEKPAPWKWFKGNPENPYKVD